jgi:uncharacterized protein (DUF2062 family)
MFRKLGKLCYEHLILPFKLTHASIPEVSWGAALGMYIALLPIVGIQMYVAATLWVFCRYALRFRFNLPIAIAMVWLTNPVTVIPIYFVYLKTGDWALDVLRAYKNEFADLGEPITYEQFRDAFAQISEQPGLSLRDRVVEGTILLFRGFGWPILVGSLFYAVPLGILSYPFTAFALHAYRKRLAEVEGLTYAEWKRKYVGPLGVRVAPVTSVTIPVPAPPAAEPPRPPGPGP